MDKKAMVGVLVSQIEAFIAEQPDPKPTFDEALRKHSEKMIRDARLAQSLQRVGLDSPEAIRESLAALRAEMARRAAARDGGAEGSD